MPSAAQIDPLFAAVREAAEAAIWSRGIELSRRAAVARRSDRDTEDELALEVRIGSGLQRQEVYVSRAGTDWECDCDGLDEVCEHVVACVLALRQGDADPGASAAPALERGRIGYRFREQARALELARTIVTGDEERALDVSISALVAGRGKTPVDVRPHDRRVDTVLGGKLRTSINRGLARKLLRSLEGCDDVRLDDRSVSVDGDPLLPVAVVEDRGDGFVVSLRRDDSVSRTYTNGFALCRGTLRPIGEAHLVDRERSELLRGRYFEPERVSELVAEVLPDLERRLPVQVRTERLPKTARERPRVRLELERRGDALALRPEIVYGDPPRARVEGERLVHLEGTVPIRDPRAEAQLAEALARDLELAPGGEVVLAPEAAIAFVPRLETFRGELAGDAHRGFFEAPALLPDLEITEDRFELRFTSGGERSPSVPAERALEAWRRGAASVGLPAGGFAPLPTDWLARFGPTVQDLLAARDAEGRVPTCALPDLATLCEALDRPLPRQLESLRALFDSFERLPEPELPADLRAELRSYQRTGVAWLGFLRNAGLGGLLADDMGLGKTLQALCAVRGRTLVVCPTSVLHGWQEQAERFRPDLRICRYHGARRTLDADADLTLTTYALLRQDADALTGQRWDTAVLDEAQAIKNPDSQVARAAYRIDAGFRITLTGTPVENRLEELWSHLHFLNPALLGPRASFVRDYAGPIENGGAAEAARLRRRITPFVLRRKKAEVAPELPPRTESVLRCELDPEERAAYEAVLASTRTEVVERLRAGGAVLEALEALLRLRQAACHRGLVPGQSAPGSTKVDTLVEALGEAASEGHRALVFSQWTSLLDRIEPHLERADLPFCRLDGSTRDRGAVVESFQSEGGPPVLLISLRAGGTGLNLTAADQVYLMDPWWNPAVEDQAADRAHRIGQERPVFVYRIVAADTIEEGILALHARKRALAESALGTADRAAQITRDDLLALLE